MLAVSFCARFRYIAVQDQTNAYCALRKRCNCKRGKLAGVNLYFARYKFFDLMRYFDIRLERWAKRKLKSLKRRQGRANKWLIKIVAKEPNIFSHLQLKYQWFNNKSRVIGDYLHSYVRALKFDSLGLLYLFLSLWFYCHNEFIKRYFTNLIQLFVTLR